MQSSSVVVDSPKPAHAQCDPEHAVYRATTAADRHMVRTHDKHSYRTQLYSASSQTLSTRLGLSQLSWPAQRVTREAARPSLVSCENNAVKYSKFQLSVERHPGSHWSCFTLLCDWSRNVAPLSQPIKDKTKTNHVLVAAFSRALVGRGNCSSFGFYDTQSKSSLERFSTTFREINTRVIITANQKTDPYRKELIRTKK